MVADARRRTHSPKHGVARRSRPTTNKYARPSGNAAENVLLTSRTVTWGAPRRASRTECGTSVPIVAPLRRQLCAPAVLDRAAPKRGVIRASADAGSSSTPFKRGRLLDSSGVASAGSSTKLSTPRSPTLRSLPISFCAKGGTRTLTGVTPLAPQASASAIPPPSRGAGLFGGPGSRKVCVSASKSRGCEARGRRKGRTFDRDGGGYLGTSAERACTSSPISKGLRTQDATFGASTSGATEPLMMTTGRPR